MSDLLFSIGCFSMCCSLATMTYGYHGGLNYEQKKLWNKAVNFQQLGALPLLLAKNCRSPLPGYLAIVGTSLFALPLYYSSITEDKTFNRVMPYGGVIMMASWITLALLQ